MHSATLQSGPASMRAVRLTDGEAPLFQTRIAPNTVAQATRLEPSRSTRSVTTGVSNWANIIESLCLVQIDCSTNAANSIGDYSRFFSDLPLRHTSAADRLEDAIDSATQYLDVPVLRVRGTIRYMPGPEHIDMSHFNAWEILGSEVAPDAPE